MLKRITCLLAVLIVLVSCVPVSFAGYADTSDNFSSEVVAMLPSVLTGNINIDYFNDLSSKAFPDRNINSIPATDEVLISCSDSSPYGVKATYYYFLAENTVLDFNATQIPQVGSWIEVHLMADGRYRYVLYDEVNRSTQLRLEREWSYYTGDYTDGLDHNTIKPSGISPDYNLTNDWLSQTTNTGEDGKPEEGIYIIAPKDGKVFSSKDSYANITVQYRHLLNPLYINPHINIYASYDGTNFENLDLSYADGLYDLNMVNQNTNVVAYGSDRYFEATITYRLSPRKNLLVTVYCDLMYQKNAGILTQPTLLTESNRVTMTWYDDFVDADGDGVDDRDNQPDYKPSQDYDKDNGVNVDGINDVTGLLDSTKGSIEGVIGFVKYYFSFIPSQVFTIISASLVICILLRIFGR